VPRKSCLGSSNLAFLSLKLKPRVLVSEAQDSGPCPRDLDPRQCLVLQLRILDTVIFFTSDVYTLVDSEPDAVQMQRNVKELEVSKQIKISSTVFKIPENSIRLPGSGED